MLVLIWWLHWLPPSSTPATLDVYASDVAAARGNQPSYRAPQYPKPPIVGSLGYTTCSCSHHLFETGQTCAITTDRRIGCDEPPPPQHAKCTSLIYSDCKLHRIQAPISDIQYAVYQKRPARHVVRWHHICSVWPHKRANTVASRATRFLSQGK